ncbi:MAG TPA: hypothetical protein VGQ53_11450 [Chitinophagaceae bacterium]|jgi:hypothetical protein|nr:hypothetical protein [Chitinophagaceae bacterium]
MPKRFFYILLVCILSEHATAQNANDTALRENALHAISAYYQNLGEESPLYNGSEYIEYAYTLQEGDPFFLSANFINGNINLDGMIFRDVPMLYDIVKDQLIIQDFQKVYKINLPADRVQQFFLLGHLFVRLGRDSSDQIKTGFYDQLYSGKTGLFAKREKKILEKYSNIQISKVVISQNVYYIKKDGVYRTIKNKSSLLAVLKNKKKEVQQYLRTNDIKFKKEPERAMIMAVRYYDQVTN